MSLLPPVWGPGLTHVPPVLTGSGDWGAAAGHSRSPTSSGLCSRCPPGGLTPPHGFKCHLWATSASPPSPARLLGPPWGPRTGRASGNSDLGPDQPPAPSPQPSQAQLTHIWSQGSRRSGASRSGPGSLTKMSPLQVTDQMACGEGRPCSLRLSQQDRLSRVSWRGRRRVSKAGLALRWRPPPPPRGPPPTHPVAHVLLGGGGQAHGPPLPRPLGGVQGEGVLGLVEHGDQRRHLVEEHVDVLHAEGGGQWDPGWSPGTVGGAGSEGLGGRERWGSVQVGGMVTVEGSLLSRNLSDLFNV